jgi:hypothetical protein
MCSYLVYLTLNIILSVASYIWGLPKTLSTNVCMYVCMYMRVCIHPKLHNINLHNITHSLISRNPREWMFIVQISLRIYCHSVLPYFMNFIINANHPRRHLTPSHCACVNMWDVTFFFFFFFYFLCYLLNVDACIRHIAQEGQVEWITLV